jgi:glycosyltransferase involved in cell wall biosynthesis
MNPCVLVSGDFTTFGGMDRANYELAWHLAQRMDARVHLVSYRVQGPLADHPNVTWHRVSKVFNSYTLAERVLRIAGRKIAASIANARVIVNGGNCDWPDVNWVHALHAAWPRRDAHAPLTFRARAVLTKWRARAHERRAIRRAQIVITNSQRSRRQLIELLGVDPARVHCAYYGIDADAFRPPTPAEREAARAALALPPDRPVIGFVGTLGWDRNKGFDTLFAAQKLLCADANWDASLVAAGAGQEVEFWRAQAARFQLEDRIRMLGFTKQVPELLAAIDLLVAPSNYESYGLAVHEALCRSLPAMVSKAAGVAERYPESLSDLLIEDPQAATALAAQLRRWWAERDRYRSLVAPFGDLLRTRSWEKMCDEIVWLVGVESSQAAHQKLRRTPVLAQPKEL